MRETSVPLDSWYPIARTDEIAQELLSLKVCDRGIVLYRREDGGVAALEDACWRRLRPLSRGRLIGDQVVCGDREMVLNSAGHCAVQPALRTIKPVACVRAFPIVERHRIVWVWPGDPALADPATLPDFHWNDDAENKDEGETFEAANASAASSTKIRGI